MHNMLFKEKRKCLGVLLKRGGRRNFFFYFTTNYSNCFYDKVKAKRKFTARGSSAHSGSSTGNKSKRRIYGVCKGTCLGVASEIGI